MQISLANCILSVAMGVPYVPFAVAGLYLLEDDVSLIVLESGLGFLLKE